MCTRGGVDGNPALTHHVHTTVTVLTGLGSRCCGGGLCLLPRLSSLDQHPHYQQWTVFANSSHCNTMFNAILIIKTNHSTPWLTPQVEWQHSLHNLLVTHKNFTQKRKIDLGWFIWWHLTTETSPTKQNFTFALKAMRESATGCVYNWCPNFDIIIV